MTKVLFPRRSALNLRTLLLLLLSVALMITERQYPLVHHWRNQANIIVYPLQRMVDAPIRLVHWLTTNIVTKQQLLAENAQLRANAILLQAKLHKLLLLERENASLHQLLRSSNASTDRVIEAQLMAVSLDPSLDQFVLDQGQRSRVYIGQPVLDAYGVMGQIVDVMPLTSKMMLVTDKRAAVPVENARTGARAIAIGLGMSGRLQLIHFIDVKAIRIGDQYVASGLARRFPAGYPVGTVMSVQQTVSGHIVLLKVAAHLDRTRQVLLAWPNQFKLKQVVQKTLNRKHTHVKQKH